MKRILLSILLAFAVFSFGNAETVNLNTAKRVAENYLSAYRNDATPQLNLAFQCNEIALDENGSTAETPLYYVFDRGHNQGFIIVSAEDNAVPVLGYTDSGSFDPDNMPRNFRKWMEGYKKEIAYIIDNDIRGNAETLEEWQALKSGTVNTSNFRAAVNPLVSATWDQGGAYNDLCPGGSVTGCVATAMAQIMKFWEHPAQGTGFHSYNEDDYGTLSANFGSTTYQWSSMPNSVTSSNNAVATLMYHCGVSVDMNYSPQVSNAYVINAQSPIQHCSEYALKTYFDYKTSMQSKQRVNYSMSSWIQLLKTELDASRPILYAGFGSGGGHAFVCDGYDNNDFFHFNWGWGGAYDGYFYPNALNPSGTGTGGGTGGYNSGQQILIGIEPNGGGGGGGSQTYDLELYNFVSSSSSTIYYGQAFDVTTNVLNNGTNNFSGDYGAAAFDVNGTFIDFVEVHSGWSLPSGNVYNNDITFSTTGLLSLLPGTYTISVFYRPTGGNWTIVGDGSYSNITQINVINPNDIEVNSNMNVTPGTTLTQGESASVDVNILNNGSFNFVGTYAVDLYDLNGDWVESIGQLNENNGLPAGYTYNNPLTFTTSEITAAPGTYLLAVTHLPSGGSWELSGSSFYQNPIYVTVQGAPLSPDAYENNNTEGAAYNLSANFSGNNATVLTTGSNSHTGDDYDYYQINLPSGYNYTITARAHDSYNSGNGQTYTQDVLWSYSTGGSWSNAYDDVMNSNITLSNGGTVKFHIAPYFPGETGTYVMDIQISRTATSGIDEAMDSGFSVFPNPAKEMVSILNESNIEIENISILDLSGKQVMQMGIANDKPRIDISIVDLAAGTYFLHIQSEKENWQQKIIKVE